MKKITDHILYMRPSCPYCVRVFNAMESLQIEMEMRDISNPKDYEDLKNGGGKTTVPCLKIVPQNKWMYESLDIIDYLKKLN